MVEAVSEMSTKVDKRHMVGMQEIETVKKMSTEVDVKVRRKNEDVETVKKNVYWCRFNSIITSTNR